MLVEDEDVPAVVPGACKAPVVTRSVLFTNIMSVPKKGKNGGHLTK